VPTFINTVAFGRRPRCDAGLSPRAAEAGPSRLIPRIGLDLLHVPRDHFLLRNRRLLVLADGDARRRSLQELARPCTGGDHEFERIGKFAAINHEKVLTMVSTAPHMR